MGVHSCTGLMRKGGVADCITGWGVGDVGELASSSTFTVRWLSASAEALSL